MEIRVMRTLNWMVSASLLLSLSAVAQQPADSQPTPVQMSAPAATPDQAQPATVPTAQPATTPQVPSPAPAANAQPAPPQAGPQPSTMDQVVDRFVMREKGLIKMLQTRTPVIETYLQNLTLDPALGPVPQNDKYFLGRMDLSTTIDRKDYIKDDQSMEKHLLGGFS